MKKPLERWGSPKEYASYYKLLLTNSGRREFLWWLEKQNAALYQLLQKELSRDRPIQPYAKHRSISGTAQPGVQEAHVNEGEIPSLGLDLLAGGDP